MATCNRWIWCTLKFSSNGKRQQGTEKCVCGSHLQLVWKSVQVCFWLRLTILQHHPDVWSAVESQAVLEREHLVLTEHGRWLLGDLVPGQLRLQYVQFIAGCEALSSVRCGEWYAGYPIFRMPASIAVWVASMLINCERILSWSTVCSNLVAFSLIIITWGRTHLVSTNLEDYTFLRSSKLPLTTPSAETMSPLVKIVGSTSLLGPTSSQPVRCCPACRLLQDWSLGMLWDRE